MHPNVKEIQDIQELQLENADLREVLRYADDKNIHLRDAIYKEHIRARKLKDENTKLRIAAKDAWILFLKHGAVSSCDLPEVDRVRESLNELGVKVSWEELGIEVGE